MKYGSPESVKFTEDVSREMAVAGWEAALELAREKGPAPIMNEEFTVTERDAAQASGDGAGRLEAGRADPGPPAARASYSRYMQRVAEVAPQLVDAARRGRRALHASHLDRAHRHDFAVAGEQCVERHRAVVRASLLPQRDPPGQEDARRRSTSSRSSCWPIASSSTRVRCRAQRTRPRQLPDYFTTADDITPKEHVDIQAAAQKWVDSAPFPRPRTCLRITSTRASRTSTCTPTRRA